MPSNSKKPTKKVAKKPTKKSAFSIHAPLVVIAAIILAVGFLAGKSYKKVEQPSMLFVQEALGGSFRPVNAASGTYVLTIVGVKQHTLLFTDKPNRMVGSWTMSDFVTRWSAGENSFAKNPPNAVLLSHSAIDGKEYAAVVRLENPVFNAFAGTLTYNATVLPNGYTNGLMPSAERHMEDFPQNLRSPVLFIDNWGGGGI